jgi:hypothetical protein
MIGAYYKLERLPDEIRTANKIKSKARFDCTAYSDNVPGGYEGIQNFVNNKGQIYFYMTPCHSFVNTESKRLAECSLTHGSINLTSIYIEDTDYPHIGYGYPNPKRLISNGSPNPMFPFRNDAYLFLINTDNSIIELFIIPDGRNLVSSYYQILIDGGFDEKVNEMRQQAKPFYQYAGIVL